MDKSEVSAKMGNGISGSGGFQRHNHPSTIERGTNLLIYHNYTHVIFPSQRKKIWLRTTSELKHKQFINLTHVYYLSIIAN